MLLNCGVQPNQLKRLIPAYCFIFCLLYFFFTFFFMRFTHMYFKKRIIGLQALRLSIRLFSYMPIRMLLFFKQGVNMSRIWRDSSLGSGDSSVLFDSIPKHPRSPQLQTPLFYRSTLTGSFFTFTFLFLPYQFWRSIFYLCFP